MMTILRAVDFVTLKPWPLFIKLATWDFNQQRKSVLISDDSQPKAETAAYEKVFALNAIALAFLFLVPWHCFRHSKADTK